MPHLDRAAILEAVHQLSAAEQEEIARHSCYVSAT
jgi:hypothetical protein